MIEKLMCTKDYKEHFGIRLPELFIEFIEDVYAYTLRSAMNTEEVFFELFELLYLEGFSSRYFSTPIEFFPFGGNGSGGEHFGYIMHLEDQNDYKAGFYDPINSEGIEYLGGGTKEMLQNILTEDSILSKYADLLNCLDLEPNVDRDRFSINGSLQPVDRKGWHWQITFDNVGVFAPIEFFNTETLSSYDMRIVIYNRIRTLLDISLENKKKGYWATALYYLKQLYYYEGTDFEYAIILLTEMKELYQLLEREHLARVCELEIIRMTNELG